MSTSSAPRRGLPLGGLTLRGRSVLAAGASVGVCGLALRQQDLLRIAVLLLALPLVSLFLAMRGRQHLTAQRTTTPSRTSVGTPVRVRLDLTNPSRLTTGVLLAQDAAHSSLGTTPRFVLDRLPPGRSAAVAYTVRPLVRGRHRIGPLRVRVTDPFGLVEVLGELAGDGSVLVLPAVERLPPVRSAAGWRGSGDAGERSAVAAGEHGMGTREYRSGDDLRRVHWRSTARHGELMVRQDEQPRQQRATVLLDTRPRAHRGAGPTSSFERAVGASASVASMLVAGGYAVRLVDGPHPGPWLQGRSADACGLLDTLAEVRPGADSDLHAAVRAVTSGGDAGLVVAVMGRTAPADAALLAQLLPRGSASGVALLLEPPVQDADVLLDRAGWTVLTVGRAETVAEAWARLTTLAA